MSIIVGVHKDGETVLAADSMHFYGSRREHPENTSQRPKVRKVGDSFIGGVGWSVYDNILTHYFSSQKSPPRLSSERTIFETFLKLWRAMKDRYQVVNDQPHTDDQSPFANLDSTFLVVNRHGMFEVDADLSVIRFDRYVAIGSGDRYAYGALHVLFDGKHDAQTLATRAVEAAIHFDQSCGGPIETYRVGRKAATSR